MPSVTVYPNGDGTITNWADQSGGTTNIYQSIDEGVDSFNDADYVLTSQELITRYWLLGDMPSDFDYATVVVVKLRLRRSALKGDALSFGSVQLFQSDESTAVTNSLTISDTTTATNYSYSMTITGTNNKTVWDGLRMGIRTSTGTSGSAYLYAAQVDITYNATAGGGSSAQNRIFGFNTDKALSSISKNAIMVPLNLPV